MDDKPVAASSIGCVPISPELRNNLHYLDPLFYGGRPVATSYVRGSELHTIRYDGAEIVVMLRSWAPRLISAYEDISVSSAERFAKFVVVYTTKSDMKTHICLRSVVPDYGVWWVWSKPLRGWLSCKPPAEEDQPLQLLEGTYKPDPIDKPSVMYLKDVVGGSCRIAPLGLSDVVGRVVEFMPDPEWRVRIVNPADFGGSFKGDISTSGSVMGSSYVLDEDWLPKRGSSGKGKRGRRGKKKKVVPDSFRRPPVCSGNKFTSPVEARKSYAIVTQHVDAAECRRNAYLSVD
jgi:hypothetical protein